MESTDSILFLLLGFYSHSNNYRKEICMATTSHIRQFLGIEFDNYFTDDDLDSLKYYLTHDVLLTELGLDELDQDHDTLSTIYGLLEIAKEYTSSMQYTGHGYRHPLLLYIASIYYGLLYQNSTKTLSPDVIRNYMEPHKSKLIDYGLHQRQVEELIHILTYCHSDILYKPFDIIPHIYTYLFHDCIKLIDMKEYHKIILSEYKKVSLEHSHEMTCMTNTRLLEIVYNRLANSNILFFYYPDIVYQSSYSTFITDLESIVSSYSIFTEYIDTFITSTSLNLLSIQ